MRLLFTLYDKATSATYIIIFFSSLNMGVWCLFCLSVFLTFLFSLFFFSPFLFPLLSFPFFKSFGGSRGVSPHTHTHTHSHSDGPGETSSGPSSNHFPGRGCQYQRGPKARAVWGAGLLIDQYCKIMGPVPCESVIDIRWKYIISGHFFAVNLENLPRVKKFVKMLAYHPD